MSAHESQRGAVLLILLIVLGLGAASLFLASWTPPNADAARSQRTLAALSEAREALLGFAVTHGRLPRPAVSATNGIENPQPCVTEAACTGFLPWTALGVARADAWGMLLRYTVTPVYTQAPLMRTSAIATKTLVTRLPDGAIVYAQGNPNCSLGSQCLAALVWSTGARNFGMSEDGIPQPDGTAGNLDEAANAIASINLMQRAASRDNAMPGGEFDDLVLALGPELLYRHMARARVLP